MSGPRSMAGARVLLPREPAKAQTLAHKLRELGAQPFVCPVTHIVAVDSTPSREALGGLPGQYDWVAFTSQNGVEQTVAALARVGVAPGVAFAGVSVACIGHASQAALIASGIRADLVPQRHDGQGLAMAIIKAASTNLRVLLPRAENGRPELAEGLRAAGAMVTEAAVYRSEPVSIDKLRPLLDKLGAGQLDVAVFFAPSQVDALSAAVADRATETLNRLFLAAIGDTTAEHMRTLCLRVDFVAPAPDAQSLASALATRYALFKQGASDAVS